MAPRKPLGSRTANALVNIDSQPEGVKKQVKDGKHFPEDCPHHAPPEKPAEPEKKQSQPKKQGTKRKGDTQPDDDNVNENQKKRSKTTKSEKAKEGLTDVSSIQLDGESDGDVPIYATCSDIRRQLTTILQRPGVTQAGFCRAISKASGTNVTTRHLSTFRNKKSRGGKSVDGADSPAFYASWVYLEKERLVKKEKKSKHRLEMEDAWGSQGMERIGLKPYLIPSGAGLTYDNLGRQEIQMPP